jgi:chromate reductase, NAD(P)H dehydrogenase (quinone)
MIDLEILGIAGSLRAGSFNKLLLRAAAEEAPEGMGISTFDLAAIPLYNRDVEEQGDPEPVRELKEAIGEADGLLIATPEYQYGIPGVLKNALDWASRPPSDSVLKGKPVAMMGASPGMTGTARAHLQLRQTLQYNESRMVIRPEVLVAQARRKFDQGGRLVDDTARELIGELLERLADAVRERQALVGELA